MWGAWQFPCLWCTQRQLPCWIAAGVEIHSNVAAGCGQADMLGSKVSILNPELLLHIWNNLWKPSSEYGKTCKPEVWLEFDPGFKEFPTIGVRSVVKWSPPHPGWWMALGRPQPPSWVGEPGGSPNWPTESVVTINQSTNQPINQSIINPYGWCMTLLSQHFNVCTCRLWIFTAKEIPFVVWTSLLVAFSPRPWVSKLTSGWWKMCSSDIETRFSKCLRLGRSTGFGNPGFEQTSADHHVWISFFHAVAGHPRHLASGSVNWFYRFLE